MDYDLANRLFTYDPNTGILTQNSEQHIRVWFDHTSTTNSYWKVEVADTIYLVHRIAYLLMTRTAPTYVIDHIDRNTANNKWDNLRHTTRCGNGLNTKARGVSWHKTRKCWVAQIKYKGKQLYLGIFNNEEDALKAARAKREELINIEQTSIAYQ